MVSATLRCASFLSVLHDPLVSFEYTFTVYRNFSYGLANVYLTILTGSLIQTLSDIINRPAAAATLLASALSTVSVFFINYVLAVSLIGVPARLIQFGPLLNFYYTTKFKRHAYLTSRQLLEGPLKGVPLDYGVLYPAVLYILAIALLYKVIAPLVIFFCALYFCGLYTVLKFQFLFVYIPKFETGGKLWFEVFDRAMFLLLVASLSMLAYMSLKQGVNEVPALVPLQAVIYLSWNYMDKRFRLFSESSPYSVAVERDQQKDVTAILVKRFHHDFYYPPAATESRAVILPYRVGNLPLINAEGNLDDVYYESNDAYRKELAEQEEIAAVEAEIKALNIGIGEDPELLSEVFEPYSEEEPIISKDYETFRT